jgi:hypothetical protein
VYCSSIELCCGGRCCNSDEICNYSNVCIKAYGDVTSADRETTLRTSTVAEPTEITDYPLSDTIELSSATSRDTSNTESRTRMTRSATTTQTAATNTNKNVDPSVCCSPEMTLSAS